MRLAHLHIPNLIPFTHASRLQQTLVSRLLTYKKLSDLSDSQPTLAPPDPTILTFTPYPVYTTGRRDLPPPSDTSISHTTTKPPWLPAPLEPIRPILTASPPLAEYHATLRGGQTTYHGPGQLVAYTILDLRRLRIGPRAHIRLLEETVLDVLASHGVQGILSDDPGVWVAPSSTKAANWIENNAFAARKIAAVGVHLRRFVSSYGVGLNITEEPMWYFRQIVACGLEGRDATSLEGQGVQVKGGIEEVAKRFVQAFVGRLNEGTASGGVGPKIDEIFEIEEKDVLS
ncbi:lipoyl(octanoyl) transferase [Uncinocarpus reesii 1704]|uniref:Octanoyltransferase n=1 Tax=Uncinocarpus reesii (strain UAMH 1704) TaxID=336963 RepID=C4JE98_UNCRE|nr:lipoyl(octanoyl) transferase [Uncinocarpus reesii 1704]EEP75674.1 lipoyl(octanoyl) transferase [Uncinocarpus reesii 1704]